MRSARKFVTFLLLLVLAPACSNASDHAALLADAFPDDGPGATALVVKDGEVVFRGATGLANIELSVPMQPDHVLRIGSITKQFTAAAILLLHDRGRIDIADDITEYLPDFPTHGHHIAIEHLLTHTSGIFNYTDRPNYWRGNLIRTDLSVSELIDLFAGEPALFAPGGEWRYSNSGYVLLGAIIEQVTGKSYAEFMRTEIFEPLGLDDTQYDGQQIVPRRASGYETGMTGRHRNAIPISMTHAYSAGALVSTVDDLARWNAALFGGRLLSEESLRRMTTAARLNDGSETEYGYGVYVRERDGLRVISHTGGIHGFATAAYWLPDQRVFAVVLANVENTSEANNLAWRFASEAAAGD